MSLQRFTRQLLVAFAVVATLALSACNGSSSTSSGPTTVTFTYTTFSGAPKDLQAVQDAINATPAMQAKQLKVSLEPIDFAAYDQKLKLRYAAGTPCDLVFTADWANSFYSNVSQGNFLALDDLFSKYAPQTQASMSKSVVDAGRVNGKLYAIPNQQLFAKYWGVIIRKDLATKYQLDVSKLQTYTDLEPFLAQIKAKEPGITPIYSDDQLGGAFAHYEYSGIDEVAPGVGINATDASLKAFNLYTDPYYLKLAQLARKWYQAGYYSQTPLPSADAQAAFKAGKYAVLLDQARPEEPQKFKASYGYDSVQALFVKPTLSTGSIVATMTGVCRSSQHPDKAMQLLEILNNDKTVYNLICHGIANQDYTVVDQAKGVISVPATSNYNPNTDWMFGNQFNSYYTDPAQAAADLWNVSKQLNQQATPSVALGFSFDPTPVKTQVAQVNAAIKQYDLPIQKGLVDPAAQTTTFLEALKQAGIDDIVAEAQKQLTAWKTANGK